MVTCGVGLTKALNLFNLPEVVFLFAIVGRNSYRHSSSTAPLLHITEFSPANLWEAFVLKQPQETRGHPVCVAVFSSPAPPQ